MDPLGVAGVPGFAATRACPAEGSVLRAQC